MDARVDSPGSVRVVWAWSPAIVLMVLIFVVSSASDPPALPGGLSDVNAHAVVYAVLGMLVLRGLASGRCLGITGGAAVAAVVVTSFYGLSDEFHQSFVPGRTATARDLVADTVGAFLGVGIVWAWSIVLSVR